MRRSALPSRFAGFTLLEVLLACLAAAILLTALYGLFGRAVKLRDQAAERMRESRLRARARSVLRNDLLSIHLVSTEMSGGFLASTTNEVSSRFPGYLRFTTATGRDTADMMYGDTQEVEYYITEDLESATPEAGVLVRTVDRALLADTRAITSQERLLTNIASLEMEFYDGTDWVETYDSTDTNATAPQAVRISIYPYAAPDQPIPTPLELLVPWTTEAVTPPATPPPPPAP